MKSWCEARGTHVPTGTALTHEMHIKRFRASEQKARLLSTDRLQLKFTELLTISAAIHKTAPSISLFLVSKIARFFYFFGHYSSLFNINCPKFRLCFCSLQSNRCNLAYKGTVSLEGCTIDSIHCSNACGHIGVDQQLSVPAKK